MFGPDENPRSGGGGAASSERYLRSAHVRGPEGGPRYLCVRRTPCVYIYIYKRAGRGAAECVFERGTTVV